MSRPNKSMKELSLFVCLFFLPFLLFAQPQITLQTNNITCFGLCNGSATAIVSGGTVPYTYIWNTGATTATALNLCANTYDITVTDAAGLTTVAWAMVTQPSQLIVEATASDQICGLNPVGTAVAVPSGGTAPYTYLWSNGATAPQLSGLNAGNYTVTVTDAKGCTASKTATVIFSNEGIWLMDNMNDVRCFGENNGSVTVSPMSGSAPYTYSWSNGANTKTITGLTAGNYTVTINEAGGCIAIRTYVIAQPQLLSVAAASTNASCSSLGSVNATASGGNPGYAYLWSNGANTNSIASAPVGSYTINVTDSKGCIATATATVQGSIGNLVANTQITTPAGCNTNGTITASATSGGSGTLTYAWSNGANTAAISVASGTYTVTVSNGTGCTSTSSATLQSPATPVATVTVLANSTCTTNGSASVSVQGTGTNTYLWDNGQTTPTATNLSTGAHTVVIKNAAGCSATVSFNISQSQGPVLVTSILTQATCSTNATASVSAVGASPFTYIWSNGATTSTASNLPIGVASVTVTDASGCKTTASLNVISSGGSLGVTIAVTKAPNCTTAGEVTASVVGTGTYTFIWSGAAGQTSPVTAAPILGGTVSVTVTSSNGCTGSATLNSPPATTLSATASVVAGSITCNSASFTTSASGGQSPYSYNWGQNQTTQTITVNASGPRTVMVTDALGCVKSATVTVTLLATPIVTILSTTNATCITKGTATAAGTGGTAPLTYLWSNNAATAVASGLNAGTYTVTVTSANGCTSSATATVGLTNNGVQVGDYVWADIDQDGYQDPTEAPAPGIIAMLMGAGPDGLFGTNDDTTIGRDTTNANGLYLFDCVIPGTYVVMFTGLPTGFQWSEKNAVNDNCKDSDVNSAGQTAPFTIVAGGPGNLCLDAGFHTTCINVFSAGTIGSDQTICAGKSPATLITIGQPAGGTGPFEYVWMNLDDSGMTPTWVGIAGTNTETYNPGPLYKTSYFMRCTRRAGCTVFLETNIVTITVKPVGSPGCPTLLSAFDVTQTPNAASLTVQWSVTSELPNSSYTVQHSEDLATWVDLYKEQGTAGGASTFVRYTYVHKLPVRGDNYYRIIYTNGNGGKSVSEERKYRMKMQAFAVYPNPSIQGQAIFMRNQIAATSELTVQVYNINGQLISTTALPKGRAEEAQLTALNLVAGVYYLKVIQDGEILETKEIIRY
jgi:SdrD B-like domain/SprB repeat/Secretion system C-terminal sorting domain